MGLLHGLTVSEEVRFGLASYPPPESCRQNRFGEDKVEVGHSNKAEIAFTLLSSGNYDV
jgi:hypothetical protein